MVVPFKTQVTIEDTHNRPERACTDAAGKSGSTSNAASQLSLETTETWAVRSAG